MRMKQSLLTLLATLGLALLSVAPIGASAPAAHFASHSAKAHLAGHLVPSKGIGTAIYSQPRPGER